MRVSHPSFPRREITDVAAGSASNGCRWTRNLHFSHAPICYYNSHPNPSHKQQGFGVGSGHGVCLQKTNFPKNFLNSNFVTNTLSA
jgi:hypothetical protein